MATGGGEKLPEPKNKRIEWIHSTTLTEFEWNNINPAPIWNVGVLLDLFILEDYRKIKMLKQLSLD